MLMNTPLWQPTANTALGTAFLAHMQAHRNEPSLALGSIDLDWINILADRADRVTTPALTAEVDRLLALLADPLIAGGDFKRQFQTSYDKAGALAYPALWTVKKQLQDQVGLTHDYTLALIDLGMLRRIEDEALSDKSTASFVADMLAKAEELSTKPSHEVFRQFFEIYSEALVCNLLRARCPGLRIEKIVETSTSTPDFSCELDVTNGGRTTTTLHFFLEVKSLDIVEAPQRLPQMLDDGLAAQIELEKQQSEGKPVAIAETVIDPYRRASSTAPHDPRSLRQVIETLSTKAAGNFKAPQFQGGPTFALLNILRLDLPGQGPSTLAPYYFDDQHGGACVSGVLWTAAFGSLNSPVHKWPDFEGAGTADGHLARAGLLVDPAVNLSTPGLITLHYDDGYRFDGLFDPAWVHASTSWGDRQTESVLHAVCDDYNDSRNSFAHRYSRYSRRAKRTP